MRKYLILYLIGFVLLISSSINIIFEVANYEFNVIPDASELSVKKVEYDVTELIVNDKFYSYYKHEIDESLEDDIIIIEATAIGEVDFFVKKFTSYNYIDSQHVVDRKYFWIESTTFRPKRYFESILSQIKEKKIYDESYQLNRYQIKLYMNSNTAKKYVNYK